MAFDSLLFTLLCSVSIHKVSTSNPSPPPPSPPSTSPPPPPPQPSPPPSVNRAETPLIIRRWLSISSAVVTDPSDELHQMLHFGGDQPHTPNQLNHNQPNSAASVVVATMEAPITNTSDATAIGVEPHSYPMPPNWHLFVNQSTVDRLRAQFEQTQASTHRTERLCYGLAYGLIVMCSLAGNVLVCRVCLSTSPISRTNALILSLAVSDLAMTVFNIPFNYVRLLNYSWPFGAAVCFVVNFVQHLVVYSSSYCMAVIAVQRYFSVCCFTPFQRRASLRRISLFYGHSHHQFCSLRTIVVVIAVVWAMAALMAICFTFNSTTVVKTDAFALVLAVFVWRVNEERGPFVDHHHHHHNADHRIDHHHHQSDPQPSPYQVPPYFVYRCANPIPDSVKQFIRHHLTSRTDLVKSAVVFTTQYLIPLIVAGVLYIQIGRTIARQGKIVLTNSKEATSVRMVQRVRRRRRLLMLVLVVAVFGVCWLPLHTYHLLIDAGLVYYDYKIFMLVHWVAMSSVCYNPFIYCWLNKRFRSAAIRMFCGGCGLCCCTRNTTGTTTTTTNKSPTGALLDKHEIVQTPTTGLEGLNGCELLGAATTAAAAVDDGDDDDDDDDETFVDQTNGNTIELTNTPVSSNCLQIVRCRVITVEDTTATITTTTTSTSVVSSAGNTGHFIDDATHDHHYHRSAAQHNHQQAKHCHNNNADLLLITDL